MTNLRGFLLAARHAALTGLRGKRLLVLLAIGIMPILAMLSIGRGSGAISERAFHMLSYLMLLQFVVPFSALFLGTSVLGDELEGRTVTYLFTRPVDRGLLYLGRLLGTGIAFTAILVVIVAIALWGREVDPLATLVDRPRVLGLAVAGFWTYFAVFACLRTLLKRSLLVGMGYLLVLDLFVGKMPYVGVVKMSIWHHLMVIYTDELEGYAPGLRQVMNSLHPDETVGGAATFLVVLFSIGVVLGAWFTRTREYPVAGAVA